ncbi:phosphopyruvate hydratase [Gryllotalpicola reticulitermitis]|uniref:Enolase n=1 Tax=Gryllotalpicola reticulitermitis TaxID=1184153 RepID=A0ABV8Q510_9MICO
MTVIAVDAEQILDSRGWPTLQVSLTLHDGTTVVASTPAGASTGAFEAAEVRDGGHSFQGRGVHKAVAAVTGEISELLMSTPWTSITEIDDALRELDGIPNLSRLGANSTVAVSMAAARGLAYATGFPLYRWISAVTGSTALLPVPHFNVLNGGAHAANELDFQEFMLAPIGAANEEHAIQAGSEIYHVLANKVNSAYGGVGLGDEGGFAPPISHPSEALDLLTDAILAAGYTTDQVKIAIDSAANGFYRGDGVYRLGGKDLNRQQLADYYVQLASDYPLWSIEDGFAEDDHQGWGILFDRISDKVQIVGDDLYVTDARRIQSGADNGYSNAALIKLNQIGTVSQTFDAIAVARQNSMRCMISHRSGETGDDFIADLAVGTGVGQIKAGAPARGERVVKYNRLMRIEKQEPTLRYGLE